MKSDVLKDVSTLRLHAFILLTALVFPVSTRQTPKVERDLAYAGAAHPSQRLDLHLPAGAARFPTVVFLHGGSLHESGERRDSPMYAGVCPALAAAGVACATADYRLAPTFSWPAMPEDAAAAFAWVRGNIAARGGDPAQVFVFGHSSGCLLAATLGANGKFLAAHALAPRDVAGVIAMGCVLSPTDEIMSGRSVDEVRPRWPKDDPVHPAIESWLDADPSRFLGAHVPPTLVMLAERERFFPAILEQGAKFVRRSLEMQRPADLVIVPGGHVSSISEFGRRGDPALAAVLAFVRDPGRIPPD